MDANAIDVVICLPLSDIIYALPLSTTLPQVFDTIPVANSLQITKKGKLFCASEFSNHMMFQFNKVRDTLVRSTHAPRLTCYNSCCLILDYFWRDTAVFYAPFRFIQMGGEEGAVVATQCADPELDDSSESAAQVCLCR